MRSLARSLYRIIGIVGHRSRLERLIVSLIVPAIHMSDSADLDSAGGSTCVGKGGNWEEIDIPG
jgi:hypothetical protein